MYKLLSPFAACLIIACSDNKEPAGMNSSELFTNRTVEGVKVFPGELYGEGTLLGVSEEGPSPHLLVKTEKGDTLFVDVLEDSILYEIKSKQLEQKKVKLIYFYSVDTYARSSSEDMDDLSGFMLIELAAENEKFSNKHRYITE